MALARFGVDRSELPIDLTDFVRQDDEEPFSRHPFWTVYRASLHTPHGSPIRVRVTVSFDNVYQHFLLGCNQSHHDRAHK